MSAFPKLNVESTFTKNFEEAKTANSGDKALDSEGEDDDDEACLETGAQDVDDLVKLVRPTGETVLQSLQERFMKGKVYTNLGHCLLSINPYEWITGMYDKSTANLYRGDVDRGKVPPHVFGVAGQAFNKFHAEARDQSILITGESGSGKTENTKKCIQYLVDAAAPGSTFEARILSTNPILEAFGNSKTCRNDNSSRFGKWIKLSFDRSFKISTCSIVTYLLEKSRVSHQPAGERNYHIFHMISTALKPALREKYGLDANGSYSYVPIVDAHGIDDKEGFQEFTDCTNKAGFTDEEMDYMLSTVAAIMHLSNIVFSEIDSNSCAVAQSVTCKRSLNWAAKLLHIEPGELEEKLCNRTIKVKSSGEEMSVPMNLVKSFAARDAMAKETYSRMFSWVVARLNNVLSAADTATVMTGNIGVLDIFGFEIFENNMFEQMCINFVNEKLQQFYNQHTFEQEERLYAAEGVAIEKTDFSSNDGVLELFDKRLVGLFSILDEECIRPSGNDKSFRTKLNLKNSTNTNLSVSKIQNSFFTVRHFAGMVTYSTENFVDMNRDRLLPSLTGLLESSKSGFIRSLFPIKATGARKADTRSTMTKKTSTTTLTGVLRNQLSALMKMLRNTTPHFIRCIKPNNERRGKMIDDNLVHHQLTCLGVISALEIQRKGYPVRMKYDNFAKTYRFCAFGSAAGSMVHHNAESETKAILTKLSSTNRTLTKCVMGRTMLFYKPAQAARLKSLQIKAESFAAIKVQALIRKAVVRMQVYKVFKQVRDQLREAIMGLEKYGMDTLQQALNNANAHGITGWVEVVSGQEMLEKAQARESVAILLIDILRNWDPSVVGEVNAVNDVELVALEKAIGTAQKVDLGNFDRFKELLGSALAFQAAGRERQRVRDRLSNAIYDTDPETLKRAIDTAESAVRVEGKEFCPELLRDAKSSLAKLAREKHFIDRLDMELKEGSAIGSGGHFEITGIEFEHLAAAIQEAVNAKLSTALGQRMLKVCQIIHDLRIATVTLNWDQVQFLMGKMNLLETVRPAHREAEVIKKELNDRILYQSLMESIESGGLKGEVGNSTNIEKVETNELEAIIRRASPVQKSAKTGLALTMAHAILRVRLAVKTQDWSYLRETLAVGHEILSEENKFSGVDFHKFQKELARCLEELKCQSVMSSLEETFDLGVLSVEHDPASIDLERVDDIIDETAASGYFCDRFQNLLEAVKNARNLRAALRMENWDSVRLLVEKSSQHEKTFSSPRGCTDEIQVIKVMVLCHDFCEQAKRALSHGSPVQIEPGLLDTSTIGVHHLRKVVEMGDKMQVTTVEAKKYLSSLKVMISLRQALTENQWSTVKSTLGESIFHRTIPSEIVDEITRIKNAMRNAFAIKRISAAIHTGCAKRSHITNVFSASDVKISNAETELSRGKDILPGMRCTDLDQLLALGEFVCDMRRYLISDSWDFIMQFLDGIFASGNSTNHSVKPVFVLPTSLEYPQHVRSVHDKTMINGILATNRYPSLNKEIETVLDEVHRRSICAMLTDAMSSNRLRVADLCVDVDGDDARVRIACKWESPRELVEISSSSSSLDRSNSIVDQALTMIMFYDEDRVLITSEKKNVLHNLAVALNQAAKDPLVQILDTMLLKSAEAMHALRKALCAEDDRAIKNAIQVAEEMTLSPLAAAELNLASNAMKTKEILTGLCRAMLRGKATVTDTGQLDISQLEVAYLEKMLKEAEETMERTQKDRIISDQVLPYIRAASLLLNLRRALMADDMEVVNSCCFAAKNSETELPELVLHEVNVAKREAQLRLILEDLTAAMASGSAVGGTGIYDVTTVSTRHLEAAISKSQQLSRNVESPPPVLKLYLLCAMTLLSIRKSWRAGDWEGLSSALDGAKVLRAEAANITTIGEGVPSIVFEEIEAASKECEFRNMLGDLNISRAKGKKSLERHGSPNAVRAHAAKIIAMGESALEYLDRSMLLETLAEANELGIHFDSEEQIRILCAIPEQSFMEVKLRSALASNDSKMISQVTVEIKSRNLEGCWGQYAIDRYPGLRKDASISWAPVPLEVPLTHLDHQGAAHATKLSKLILGVMRERFYPYPVGCLNEIIKLGVVFPEVRDEIYCQICGQMTGNPDPMSIKYGWDLMASCISFFPPGSELENYLEEFLRRYDRMDLVVSLHEIIFLGSGDKLPSLREVVGRG